MRRWPDRRTEGRTIATIDLNLRDKISDLRGRQTPLWLPVREVGKRPPGLCKVYRPCAIAADGCIRVAPSDGAATTLGWLVSPWFGALSLAEDAIKVLS